MELFGQVGDVSGIIIIVNFYFKVDQFVSDYIPYLLISFQHISSANFKNAEEVLLE